MSANLKAAKAALVDEYQRAILELIQSIKDLSKEDLVTIVDQHTTDPDCRSIQSILSHVVESGYAYIVEIRKWLGEDVDYFPKEYHDEVQAYIADLHKMLDYSRQLFVDKPDLKIEDHLYTNKITVRWGQLYDPEQLWEHAIVHILRHRRQIGNFKEQLRI